MTTQPKSNQVIAVVLVALAALLATPFYLQHKKEQREALVLLKAQFASDARILDIEESIERTTGREIPAHRRPLLQDSERRFVEACRSCASAEACERERLSVVRGLSSEAYTPCD